MEKRRKIFMKTSLEHLPDYHQKRIRQIAAEIAEKVSSCEMVILYGSYARGDYVEYDERTEFGIHTTFQSDYDILVVTGPGSDMRIVAHVIRRIKERFRQDRGRTFAPVQIITERMNHFSEYVRDARYFYKDIMEEGILLYDSGKFPLPKRERVKPSRFREMAQEYYDEWIDSAEGFYLSMQLLYQEKRYKLASFMLHQMTEKLYCTVLLVFTLDKKKIHDLEELRDQTKSHARSLLAAFPLNTKEEERLFDLLCRAYIESRYNSEFVVTQEELDALIPCVLRLKEIVAKVCTEKIASIVDD